MLDSPSCAIGLSVLVSFGWSFISSYCPSKTSYFSFFKQKQVPTFAMSHASATWRFTEKRRVK